MKPEINNISWRHCNTDRTVKQSTGHCLHNSKNIIKVTLSIGCYGQHWFKSNLNSVLTDSKKNIINRESVMKVTQQNTENINPLYFHYGNGLHILLLQYTAVSVYPVIMFGYLINIQYAV